MGASNILSVDGYSFPSYSLDSTGSISLLNSQSSYIPGDYKLKYNIEDINGNYSNIAYINLHIYQNPLQLLNFNNEDAPYGVITNISHSFDVIGGTPLYSYSFDNINYTNISGFQPTTISGTVSTIYNTLYVKDYLGNIVSESFNPFYDETTFTLNIVPLPSCDSNAAVLYVSSSQGEYYSIDGGVSQSISSSIEISSGSHNIYIYDIYGGIVSSSFTTSNLPSYTYDLVTSSLSCFTNNGSININNFINTYSDNIDINVIYPSTSSSLFTSSLNLSGLEAGTYEIQIYDGYCSQTSSIVLNPYPDMIVSSSISYENECYPIISMSVSGGYISIFLYNNISIWYIFNNKL